MSGKVIQRLVLPCLAGAVLGALAAGCAHTATVGNIQSSIHDSLRDRSTNNFARATLLKPSEQFNVGQAFQFAPLIFHEVTSATSAASNTAPGSLNFPGATVYCDLTPLALGQLEYSQYTYLWFYGVTANERPSTLPQVQGVRVTLDRKGFPVIWEVLSDSSGNRLIYVSTDLETKAKAQFGGPLPGRRYSIERSVQEAPHTVVVRVLDDAATAMGPIVYVGATPMHDVNTVLCRCMPVQAEELAATDTYSVLPLALARAGLIPSQWAAYGLRTLYPTTRPQEPAIAFWPGVSRFELSLPQTLRLPDDFYSERKK
jgi:hypothetical protein